MTAAEVRPAFILNSIVNEKNAHNFVVVAAAAAAAAVVVVFCFVVSALYSKQS